MKYFIAIAALLAFLFIPFRRVYAQSTWQKAGISNNHLTTIKTTPWGILLGENDSRIWQKPFNGIKISTNKGESWREFALNERGITDIDYFDGKLYASTYYFVNGTAGLFESADGGKTWEHTNHNFSTSRVTATKNVVYLGTYSHGLWIKQKDDNWVQKLGVGFYGPKVIEIEAKGEKAIVSTSEGTYMSLDYGSSWNYLEGFKDVKITSALITDNIMFIGTDQGLFKSFDNGKIWNKVQEHYNSRVSTIVEYKGNIYISAQPKNAQNYEVFVTTNSGNTWANLEFEQSTPNIAINSMDWIFSSPEELFITQKNNGAYKTSISAVKTPLPLFRIPWNYKNESELINNITSFFDHKYPFLGYVYKAEPLNEQNLTMNFFGEEGQEPEMYYSSHNGIDFGLPFGTDVLAAADGIATYDYDALGLGNYIKVNHQNGYETVYAHLQPNGLAVTQGTKQVKAGDYLGKIGLSGNTTGPHLHFEVTKDVNNSNTFEDDLPYGKVDPFGWQSQVIADPWPNYLWTDTLGTHRGVFSSYNWDVSNKFTNTYINEYGGNVELENIKLDFPEEATGYNFTVFVKPYPAPKFDLTQNKLTYLSGSSFLINMYGNLGKELPPLLKPVKIEIDFSEANLDNIKENSIYLYYFNEQTQEWEKISSVVDLINRKIYGETNHFSRFAVLAEKIDNAPPTTQVQIEGTQNKGLYSEYPTITLTSEGSAQTLYSLDDGISWSSYENSFKLNREGTTNIMFKSYDEHNNWEEAQTHQIKVDTQGKWRDTATISISFSVENFE